MSLYKQCAKPMCRELIETPERYCEKHADSKAERQYNSDRSKYQKEYTSFYGSSAWKKMRNKVKRRDDYVCRHCLSRGLITPGTLVDHIIPTKIDWDKRLDINNLQLLCDACHNIKTHEDEQKYFKKK